MVRKTRMLDEMYPPPAGGGGLSAANLMRAAQHVDVSMSWRRELAGLVRTYIDRKGDGRRLSSRTRAEHFEVLFAQFEILRAAGHRARPSFIGGRHINFLCRSYAERMTAGTLKPSTVQVYLSVLRRFCDETGRPGLVPPTAKLFPEHAMSRSYIAQDDKSWDAAGVDFGTVFAAAAEMEPFVAMALLAQCSFGLRRQEALCLVPLMPATDGPVHIDVVRGAKGGRKRVVPVETPEQHAALVHLAEWVQGRDGAPGGTIGPLGLGRSLRANLRRYAYVLESVGITRDAAGVTGHGLRAQWALEFLERRGHVPTVRTADGKPADLDAASRAQVLRAYGELALATGHSRPSIGAAYVGALPRKRRGEIAPDED